MSVQWEALVAARCPVADLDNLTHGNSASLFVFGKGQNDRFEVNHNRAKLFLHGGSGDDRFLLKTFLVLLYRAIELQFIILFVS